MSTKRISRRAEKGPAILLKGDYYADIIAAAHLASAKYGNRANAIKVFCEDQREFRDYVALATKEGTWAMLKKQFGAGDNRGRRR